MGRFLKIFPPIRVDKRRKAESQKTVTGLQKILQVGVLKEEFTRPDWKNILSGETTVRGGKGREARVVDMFDSSDGDVSEGEMEALRDVLAKASVQGEKKMAEDAIPGANDWAMMVDANHRGKEEISGQFDGTAIGCRDSTP